MMNERPPRAECGTQDAQYTLSPYSTTNAVGFDSDPIQVGDSGDSATAPPSVVPITLSDRVRLLSHDISRMKNSSISARLGVGIELVKEIYVLHSTSSHNTTELKILANQVENFIHGIKKDYQECQDKDNWPPPLIKDNVFDFLEFLNKVHDIVGEIQEEGPILGMIHARTIANRIKALKESMVSNILYFKICSEIAIQHNLRQVLKSQKQTILTQTSTSGESVNDVIHWTNAQFTETAHIASNVADTQRLGAPHNQKTSLKPEELEETERNRLAAEETEQDRIVWEDREHEEQSGRAWKGLANLGTSIEKREVRRRPRDGETAFDNGEKEMKEAQGLLDEEYETRIQPFQEPTSLVEETRTEEQRDRNLERIRKLDEGRHSVMEWAAKLDLEPEGYVERKRLLGLAEHSSSPPSTEHAKEADLENEAVASIRPKRTVRVKKSKKKSDGSASTTPLEMRFASTNMASARDAFPMQVHSSPPPIFPPPPYHQHGLATSYALPYPVYPSMGAGMMYPSSYWAPPSYNQSHSTSPWTTVNNINSGNIANVTISNVNNNNYGKSVAHPKRT